MGPVLIYSLDLPIDENGCIHNEIGMNFQDDVIFKMAASDIIFSPFLTRYHS